MNTQKDGQLKIQKGKDEEIKKDKKDTKSSLKRYKKDRKRYDAIDTSAERQL